MPKVIPRRTRKKKAQAAPKEPEYYYTYVGSIYQENIKAIELELQERGIVADYWQSCNGMIEYRIKASEVVKCPDLNIAPNADKVHQTKGFPYITGSVKWPSLLYIYDSTHYLKDEKRPWKPVQLMGVPKQSQVGESPRRRRKKKNA